MALARWLLGLIVCLVSACGSREPPPPPASTAAPEVAAQDVLDSLSQAVLRRDQAALGSLLEPGEPTRSVTEDRLHGLSRLPLVQLSFLLRERQQELTATRRNLLGPRAFVQQVAVTWRLSDDLGPAEHLVWMTFVPGVQTRVAGLSDGPVERTAQPVWMVERIQVGQSDRVTVIAGSAAAAAAWQPRALAATTAVGTRLRAGLGSGWGRRLVLEVPSSLAAFERVLGVQPGSYREIAAVAWPEGPDVATAALRIVVNPELTAGLDAEGLAVLLAHETVHVATRSPASPAPTWLLEGMADYVAYEAYPRTAPTAAAALLERVSQTGAPAGWPANARFSPAADDLSLSYAEAWSVCRFLAERYSPLQLARFYVAVDGGTEVESALHSQLGVGTAAATARWRDYLESAADRA